MLTASIVKAQLPGYYFYKTITIHASQVAGSGSHTDFPILISENDADLAHLSFGGDVQNINGYDIAFTAADGTTLLDHQIEDYDETTGELEAWVRIPLLSASVDTEIRMYYGNGNVTTDASTDNVWDANFAAVYHLTDDFEDKTNNNNDITNNGTSNEGNAQVAKGRKFNPGDYLQAPNSASIAIDGDVTLSTWIDIDNLQFGAFENSLLEFGGLLEIAVDNKLYSLNVRSDLRLNLLWEYGLGFDEVVTSVNPITLPSSGFTQITVSRDVTNNEVKFYQDGVLIDAVPSTYTNDPLGGTLGLFRVGQNYQFTAEDFDGKQDEIRISNNVRSDDWILTDYNTVSDPSTFYSKGPEVNLFGVWQWIDEGATVNEEWGNDIAVDSVNQFVYTAGTLTDRNAFGISAGILNGSSDNGNKDGFLAKHDFNGNLIWIITLGGNLADEATSVTLDEMGNPYVAGYYTNYIAAHSSDLSQDNPGGATGGEDIFIAKYSPAGILDWVVSEGGSGSDRAHAIEYKSGALYVAGVYENSATFGSINSENTNNTTFNTFLSKHQLVDGTAEWLMEVKSNGDDVHPTETIENSSMDITSIKDTIFVIGYMGGTNLSFVDGSGTLLGSPNLTDANPGGNDIFVYAADTSGNFVWAQKIDNIDSPNQLGFGISADCEGVYIAGNVHDGAIFPGPDVVGTDFHDKMIIAKLQHGDGAEVWLKEFDNSPTNHVDIFHDIKADGYGNLFVCGTVLDAVSNSDTTLLATSEQSVVIFKYSNDGTFQWAQQSVGSGSDKAYAINTYRKDYVFMTGEYSLDFQLASVIVPSTTNNRNFFLTKMNTLGNGTPIFCCAPPTIDLCQNDTVVTADPSCNHTLGDYTVLINATDNCGGGLTYTQSPASGTILSSGMHEISLYIEDSEGKIDSCTFNLTIEADVNPIVVDCGDVYTNQTTGGGSNTSSSFSCSSVPTPGQDVYYQITVPTGNYFLYFNIDNVIDSNDDTLHAYWVGSNCPLGASCLESYSYDIANQQFVTNNSNTESVLAVGPGTYYLVIDAEVDSIQSYDIWFDCLTSGIEFDTANCSGNDSNNDGIVPKINSSSTVLDIKTCETVNICHDLYINNINDFEWLDSVEMKLGPCFENINTATLTPDLPNLNTGFYDTNGEWDATYTSSTNTIMWEFDHSSVNPWGDGNAGPYTCNLYTFCFDADITSGCLSSDSAQIVIGVWDDAIPVGITVGGFDSEVSDDFNLLPPDDAGWSYPSTTFCQGNTNPTPTISGTSGGTFSSTAGLVWADQPNGIINLAGSTPGTYDITYTVGLCAIDSVINITIENEDDPFFEYSQTTFCSGDADPSPSTIATPGGSFSSTAGLTWADQPNGIIDLSASSPATYTITYLTGGTCPNSATFDVTISPEEVAFFNYPQTSYCAGDTDPTATNVLTSGGTFSSTAGLVWTNQSNGTIDLNGSTPGTYTITYTTSGTCFNSATFDLTIVEEDDPAFSYATTDFCESSPDQDPNFIATPGGTFSSFPSGLDLDSGDGEVEIDDSSVGDYTIYYTTSGTCPNIDSVTFNILPTDDPSFDYPQTSYCAADGDPSPTNVATAGGTYSSTAGLVWIDQPNGIIDLSASTPATYTITYTTAGACSNTATFHLTIEAEDDPFFDYPQTSYCPADADPSPTNVATAGGTYSSTSGLVWADQPNGIIDLSASTPATYTITYTTAGNCPNSTTFDLTIVTEDDPNFDYPQPSYCVIDSDPAATNIATNGGTFSSTTGIIFSDNSTGLIDLDASILDVTHTIQYLTNGTCPDSSTFEITIVSLEDPSFDYAQTTFCQNEANPSAINIATPGGLFTSTNGLNWIDDSNGTIDLQNSTPGSYTVQYTTPGPNCQDTQSMTLTIEEFLSSEFNYTSTEYCITEGNQVPESIANTGGIFTSSDGNLSIDQNTGEIDFNNSNYNESYEVKYIFSGTCADSSSVYLTIFETPEAIAGDDQILDNIDNTFLNAVPSPYFTEWTIISGNGILEDISNPTSQITELSSGQNALEWLVENGTCPEARDTVIITVNQLWIPNLVTPNGDGDNETFEIKGIENSINKVQIFNRWGQIVLDQENYENDWDGHSTDGTLLEDDTYFYIITIDNSETYKGFLVLKR
ncbi:MAG: DUF2341 domain-containing protein [Crocinitomicaceae bacterium]